jgi:hypothetical protein
MFSRVFKEPLLHFLCAGALLFALFGRNAPDANVENRGIVVSSSDVERLGDVFERTWHRPPSDDELRNAVNEYVREEVLYRTALSLGLDKNDMIIRRRLRQKMDFLFEDTVPPPPQSELRDFYAQHQDKFRVQAVLSFRQVFIDIGRHHDAEADAGRLLASLQSGSNEAAIGGDPMLLAEGFKQTPIGRIADLFGQDFAKKLVDVPQGRWSGPLQSAFGFHLVLLSSMEPAHVPSFERVRDAVLREWFAQHRAAALDEEYRKLRSKFDIRVDYPTSETSPQ